MSAALAIVGEDIATLLESSTQENQVKAAKRLAMRSLRELRLNLLKAVTKLLAKNHIPFMATGSIARACASDAKMLGDCEYDLELAIMEDCMERVEELMRAGTFSQFNTSVKLEGDGKLQQVVVAADVYNGFTPTSPVLMVRVLLQKVSWTVTTIKRSRRKRGSSSSSNDDEEEVEPSVHVTQKDDKDRLVGKVYRAADIFPFRESTMEGLKICTPFNLSVYLA